MSSLDQSTEYGSDVMELNEFTRGRQQGGQFLRTSAQVRSGVLQLADRIGHLSRTFGADAFGLDPSVESTDDILLLGVRGPEELDNRARRESIMLM
ncbi:MAG: hypothetical protein ACTIC1_00080 [Brevibacterium sp.]